jgi:hypothetical protein
MTSPRQRKKMAAYLAKKQKQQEIKVEAKKIEQKPTVSVATAPASVVESAPQQQPKSKKVSNKNELVETKAEETKPVDQVLEQQKQEVKTQTKE